MLVRRRPGSEIRFWLVVWVLLASVVHGWYGPTLASRLGQPLIGADGSMHPGELLAAVSAYGVAGREPYLVYLSLACLPPVAASMLLLRLFEALRVPEHRTWRPRSPKLTALGVLPALSQLLENTLLALLTVLYPAHGPLLASLTYGATALKLASAAGALLTLAVLATRWLRWQVEGHRPQRTP